MSNFISFVASVAELAHGEKLHTHLLYLSIIRQAYLIAQEPKLAGTGMTAFTKVVKLDPADSKETALITSSRP